MVFSFGVSLRFVHAHTVYHWLLGAVEVCRLYVLQAGCNHYGLLVYLGPIVRHRLNWNQIGLIVWLLAAHTRIKIVLPAELSASISIAWPCSLVCHLSLSPVLLHSDYVIGLLFILCTKVRHRVLIT